MTSTDRRRPASALACAFLGVALPTAGLGCGGPSGPAAPPVDLSKYETLQGSSSTKERPSLGRGAEGVDSYGDQEEGY